MNYRKQYFALIGRRINNPPCGYSEKHHILPRALGGSDEQSNIVKLTPKEHFIAHRFLAKIHGGKMWAALAYMTRGNTNSAKGVFVSSRVYALSKKKDSEWRSKYYSENNPFKGSTFTTIQLEKMRGPRPSIQGSLHPKYGKKYPALGQIISFVQRYDPRSVEYDFTVRDRINRAIVKSPVQLTMMATFYKKKIAMIEAVKKRDYTGKNNPNYKNGGKISGENNPMFGRHQSDTAKRKISEKAKRKIECPNCGKIGSISNMKRWHFDNCPDRQKNT